jgi:hypothetical protein
MFKFSEIHNWQEDPAVKQILVFPSQLLKDEFEKEFAIRVEKDGKDKASDSNAGAVYKIRAVKNGSGKWDGMVRCGSSGELLFEQVNLADDWDVCLISVTNLFIGNIRESCYQLFNVVLKNSVRELYVSVK